MSDQIDLRIERLAAHGVIQLGSEYTETVVVILGGTCAVAFWGGGDSPAWPALGARSDVFDGPATAFYLPVGRQCQVVGGVCGVQLACIATAASTPYEPYVVRSQDIRSERRGRDAWTREVHDIIGPGDPADRLLVGETFSAGGVWSSYPPHKHDTHEPPYESELVEAFHVRVSPPSGFGVFVHYPTIRSERRARVVNDGDVVHVADGFHSFAVAAGYQLYYLWALAGRERALRFRTDDRDAWLLTQDGQ